MGIYEKLKKYKSASASSHSSCLLEFLKQKFIGPKGEGQSPFLIVHGVHHQVVNHVCQEMGSLNRAAWGIIAQGSEMHVQVVVGGLVMQVDTQLGSRHAEVLHYSLLRRKKQLKHRSGLATRRKGRGQLGAGSAWTDRPCNRWKGASWMARKAERKAEVISASSILTARERGMLGRTELFPILCFSLRRDGAMPPAAPLFCLHDGTCSLLISFSLPPLSLRLARQVTGILLPASVIKTINSNAELQHAGLVHCSAHCSPLTNLLINLRFPQCN